MKVICINNSNRSRFFNLTIGRQYSIQDSSFRVNQSVDLHSYFIRNDRGEYVYYSRSLFNTIEDMRDQKLNQIL